LLLTSLITWGCNREKEAENNSVEFNTGADNAQADQEASNVENLVNEQTQNKGLGKTSAVYWTLPSGAIASWDTSNTLRTLTIDFGSQGILCGDGRMRKGKIIVTWTGA